MGFQQVAELVPRGASDGRIRGLSVQPASVSVAVDVQKSTVSKTVPLTIELLGEPARGYRVAGVTVTPAAARVVGTLELLQDLEELPLGFVRLDGADGDIRLNLVAGVPQGLTAPAGSRARVVVTVEPVLGSSVVTVAPEADGVPDGMVVDLGDQVVTVVLEGPLPALNALGAGDVRVEVDVSVLDGDETGFAEVTVVAPGNVTVREWRPALLSITLSPLPTGDEG